MIVRVLNSLNEQVLLVRLSTSSSTRLPKRGRQQRYFTVGSLKRTVPPTAAQLFSFALAVLFDWFFNGRTGYRAHFRADPRNGSSF